jgi:hypothetical protein
MYKFVAYGVHQDDERIDYDEIDKLAHEHKPKMIVRRQRLFANHRFRAHRENRQSCRRSLFRGHGPHCRPGRRRTAPQPHTARRHRLHHHAQNFARASEAWCSAKPPSPRNWTS